jgi:hypothetical protein
MRIKKAAETFSTASERILFLLMNGRSFPVRFPVVWQESKLPIHNGSKPTILSDSGLYACTTPKRRIYL